MRHLRAALFIGFLTFQTALAHPLVLRNFQVTPTEKGALVEVDSYSEEVSIPSLKLPVEGVVFQVRSPRELVEADVFQSGLAVDVNGDGDTDDVFELTRKDGRDFLQDTAVEPFASTLDTQKTGDAKVYQLAPSGPKFLVYQTRPDLVAGMDFKGREAGFMELPNPSLQLMVIEECDGPEGDPAIVMEGAERVVFAFEKSLDSPGNQWHRIQWQPLAVDEEHEIKLSGKGEGFLVLFVNWAPEEGVRKREVLRATPLEL